MTSIDPSPLAAVLADPGSDLHRGVYADWLEDNATYQPCPGCCPPEGVTRPGAATPGTVTDPKKLLRWDADGRWVMDAPRKCPRCDGQGTVSQEVEWAELIRVQLDLARPEYGSHSGLHLDDGSAYACRACSLRRRERDLSGLCSVAGLLDYRTLQGWTVYVGDVPDDFPNSCAVWWRRGFIDKVRGTLAQLLGGECGRCDGGRRMLPPGPAGYGRTGPCSFCGGVVRTTGVLHELCRKHPVQVVLVADKDPELIPTVQNEPIYRWWKDVSNAGELPYVLPPDVFDRLPNGSRFNEVADANRDLSRALLAKATEG